MDEVLTLAQIEARYRSEWILVVDPVTDRHLTVLRGRVAFHDKNRDKVYRRAAAMKPKSFAMLFTGKLPRGKAIVL